jgi:hypothetical membrane protein
MISELGASGAASAWLMNYVGFVVSGVLVCLFGLTLFTLPRSASVVVGAALVVVFGLGTVVAGLVSCDLGCASVAPSVEQQVHEQVSQIAFTALIFSTLVWGAHFARAERGWGFGPYSLLTGVAAITLLTAFILSIGQSAFVGLFQRGLMVVLYVWLAEFARRVRGQWATVH